MIYPLHDKKIPEYKFWYDIIDYFHTLGVKFQEKKITSYLNPDIKELEIAFKHFADNVEAHIQPFLGGDFSKMNSMDEIIRERAGSI
jgi:hypothetical protein